MAKIGFIGAGNMGGALATAAAKAGNTVMLADTDAKKALSLAEKTGATVSNAKEICECADYIFLGVKPQVINGVLESIKDFTAGKTGIVVSMAAGVSISQIEGALGKNVPIIRIMPNMPVAAGSGMVLYTYNGLVSKSDAETLADSMKSAGKWAEISESLIDAGSAVSGCGPAFVFMFIEALADGGVECGLTRAQALEYAAQTVAGSAEMILAGGHTGQLKDAVCSPAGSTIEGVKALENAAFRAGVMDAVYKSYLRTKELGKK